MKPICLTKFRIVFFNKIYFDHFIKLVYKYKFNSIALLLKIVFEHLSIYGLYVVLRMHSHTLPLEITTFKNRNKQNYQTVYSNNTILDVSNVLERTTAVINQLFLYLSKHCLYGLKLSIDLKNLINRFYFIN